MKKHLIIKQAGFSRGKTCFFLGFIALTGCFSFQLTALAEKPAAAETELSIIARGDTFEQSIDKKYFEEYLTHAGGDLEGLNLYVVYLSIVNTTGSPVYKLELIADYDMRCFELQTIAKYRAEGLELAKTASVTRVRISRLGPNGLASFRLLAGREDAYLRFPQDAQAKVQGRFVSSSQVAPKRVDITIPVKDVNK